MIFDELYQYSLHDTDLTDFSFDAIENRFVLEFKNGIYNYSHDPMQHEDNTTKKCKLYISVKKVNKIKEILTITRYATKERNINIKALNNNIKKYGLEIDNWFLSKVNNSIMLHAYYTRGGFNIKISHCTKVEYIFED